MGAGPSETESSGGGTRSSRAQIPGHPGATGRACRALALELTVPNCAKALTARVSKARLGLAFPEETSAAFDSGKFACPKVAGTVIP